MLAWNEKTIEFLFLKISLINKIIAKMYFNPLPEFSQRLDERIQI